MHTQRERVWASSLMRRNLVKRRLNHLYRAGLPGLCLPLANYLVSFSTPALPLDTPQQACATFFQDGFQPRGLWDGLSITYCGVVPPPFWPPMSHSAHVQCLPCPKDGKYVTSWSFTQSLVPLCSCHDCYLKMPSGDKAWVFTLFLLLLPFQRANRRLVVSA